MSKQAIGETEGQAGSRRRQVSEIQAKLHRWAVADPGRRFDDLFNFVHDPATLWMAWDRVAANRGASAERVHDAHLVKGTVKIHRRQPQHGHHGGGGSAQRQVGEATVLIPVAPAQSDRPA